MEEVWKTCKELPSYYLVSNFGNVKSLERKFTQKNNVVITIKGKDNLKSHFTKEGYKRITLINFEGKRQNFLIHRLVAITFIEKPINKDFVNHLDGNKENNIYKNLEWVTTLENEHHKQKFIKGNLKIGIHKTKSGYYAKFKNKYLGHYKTIEEALTKYTECKNENL